MNENICELFRARYEQCPEKPFLVAPDVEPCTFAAMHQLAGQFARSLRDRGVEPGDRVVVQVDKSIAAVALYLGVLRIGAVFVPLNTAYTDAEVTYFLRDAQPALYVYRAGRDADAKAAAGQAGVTEIMALGTDPGDGEWARVRSLDSVADIAVCDKDALAAFLYTSGTTGRSKGAMLSHGNLSANALALHALWRFVPDDVLIHALPIFHVHGLFVALHTALLNASTVFFHPTFRPAAVIDAMRDGGTVLMGVPTFYTRLLEQDEFSAEDCRGMRLFVSGSAPMTEQTHAAWFERTGHRILERYGMTEAGMITSNPCDGERVPGTVGFALPGTEVRVCDDGGRTVPRGEVGVLEVRGPGVFSGYWRMPEKTAAEFRGDGYFITGDLATMDAEGRVSIVGRGKDLIISGGYNVYPKEVELLLDNIDGIVESAVIGLPHADFGEAVAAVVVCDENASLDEQGLRSLLKDRLARFKQPRRVFQVDELPRNTMGKVQKNVLRDTYADTFTRNCRAD